jgi:hypothetical protein
MGEEQKMKPAHRKKRVQAEKPLDGTQDYGLFACAPEEEIIDLTEVVEEGTPGGKEGASATRKPAGAPEEFEPGREKPGAARGRLEARPGLGPRLIALPVSAKEETGPARERRPESKANKDGVVLISTKDRTLASGNQGAEDLEAHQIFAEFFSCLDAEDLSREITEADDSFREPNREKPPGNENDDFENLLEELDSTDGVIAEKTSVSCSLRGDPAAAVELQTDNENDDLADLLEEMETAERAAAEESSESHSLAGEPRATPEPQKGDRGWIATYDSPSLLALQTEITRCQEEMERRISELRAKKEKLERRYEDIRRLLYASEDELKPAVVKVFRTHWKLKVSDVENRKTPGFKDDILVEDEGRKVIFKIKSTSAARPPTKYITQLWQDLHYSGLGERVEGGLILNHDIKMDPRERSLAYIGEDEEYLQDIIFLETRVLYHLTLAIVDYGLPLQDAKELLLRKGRSRFHLDEVAG